MKRLKVRVHDTAADVGSPSCSLVVGKVYVGVLSPDNVDEIIRELMPFSGVGIVVWSQRLKAKASQLAPFAANGGAR